MRSAPQETKQRLGRWRLIQLWRLLVFSGAALGLVWVLLEQGWWVKTAAQAVFRGASPQEQGTPVTDLQHTTAQAWARRSLGDRVERGVLDHQFNWIRVDGHPQLDRFPVVQSHVLVLVDFWTPVLRDTLAELFTGLEHLQTPVQTIRITADGQLVLGTSPVLGQVHLGQPDHLERKLAVMDHLYVHLQRSGPPFSYADVDLRNPDEPNLGLSQG